MELQQIFEYELKRKLAQKCRTKNEELRFLLNSFKFYDYHSSLIIDKNKWIKGVLKIGLCGFNINDLSDVFDKYDINKTGFINYKNFCYYIYGNEKQIPIPKDYINNNEQIINYQKSDRVKSPFNDFKPPGLYERNYQMLEYEKQFNLRRTPNYSPEISKNNNYNNNINPEYYKLIQKQNPNTPFPSNSNINISNYNSNINKNDYNNNLSIQNYSLSYENNSYFKKLLLLLQSKINTDSGVTYYSFAKKLKLYENPNDKTITLNSFYSSLRDINIPFRLNDLTDLFNYIDNSKINKVKTEKILQLIRGNLNEKRKKILEYTFSLIDKDKIGRIPLDIIKNLYNYKLHPDVYVGFKQEEDIYKEFSYTIDTYCDLYNVKEYITQDQFIEYYSGVSGSIIDDNYFEDILNGVWNQNIKSNKHINSIINDNLNINKNSNENYKKELIGNKINNNSKYYLNNRYVNNQNQNKYNYINYQNDSNLDIINNKSQENNNYIYPYTPIIKEKNESERVTPYYHPVKTPLYKGVKTFRSLRHNPITNEFIMNKEFPIDGYHEYSPIKNINRNKYNINLNDYEDNKNIIRNNNNNNNDKPIYELEKFKNILISRGKKGIFNFQKILCMYDKEKKGELTYNKFIELLEIFNITMSKQSINSIFDYFDKDKKNVIKYDDLIKEIIGNISDNREIIIKKVFNSFNKDNNNNISINDLKQKYRAYNHPEVKNNLKSEKEVFFEFLESIDIFKNYKNTINGQNYNNNALSYQDFLEYYKEIGISIEDDIIFEHLLKSCWNIDNQNDIYNTSKNNELNNLKDNNLIIRTANQILNNNLINN